MAEWMGELSSYMSRWLKKNPKRNLATLKRKLKNPVSYNTLKYALEAKHATSPATVFMILDIVCSAPERASFKATHFPKYYSRHEISGCPKFEAHEESEEDTESELPPKNTHILSQMERHIVLRLARRGRLSLKSLLDFVEDWQISNVIQWLEFHELGYVDDDQLVARSEKLDVSDFVFLRDSTIDVANRIDLSKDGDLLDYNSGFTTREIARKCWEIQYRASQECRELIDDPENTGECEVVCINMMKFMELGAKL